MSAALQLPTIWAASPARAGDALQPQRRENRNRGESRTVTAKPAEKPRENLAFYRRHTESMLRRYLYASMQVGRAPSVLSDPVGRGWVSSRPVRTFEDALVFVLDVERCLGRLDSLERQLLSRVVIQAYTQDEAAVLLGMSVHTVHSHLGRALDRLTEELLKSGLLVLPE